MKKHLYSTLIGFLIICFGCDAPQRDCKKFKNGTFTFESLIDGELHTSTFTRNDTLEIDYFQNKIDSSSIRWINDCEFIVKKIHPKNRAEKKSIHMKIRSTDGDFYTFEYSIVGQKIKQIGTAKKMN